MSDPIPAEGSVYSFRTAPLSEFAAPQTSRYGALKILGWNGSYVVVAVLNWISNKPPSLDEVRDCGIIHQRRFSFENKPAIWGVNAEWWRVADLKEMMLLGAVAVSADEARHASNVFNHMPGSSFSTLNAANHAAEGEWRWAHDHDALVAEQEKVRAQQLAKRAAQEERQRTRLRALTWDQLLSEAPFERWVTSPPFPPEDFTQQARSAIHNACRALRALGDKPAKSDVRKILRACVEWFNEADEAAGGVIETEEREDICAALEEMAWVARQKSLVGEIENWRNW